MTYLRKKIIGITVTQNTQYISFREEGTLYLSVIELLFQVLYIYIYKILYIYIYIYKISGHGVKRTECLQNRLIERQGKNQIRSSGTKENGFVKEVTSMRATRWSNEHREIHVANPIMVPKILNNSNFGGDRIFKSWA